MNIVKELVTRKIADNDFHAAGMLNVLECYKLETDEQRIARCELYKAWCEYYKEPKKGGGFKISKENKFFARKFAIAGEPVPDKQYWLMDGRANYDVDSAYVLECCSSLDEAKGNINKYGADTCIVDADTQKVVDSLLWRIAGDPAPAPMEER